MICIIGDIHGCLEELKELYSKIPKNTQVYCTGDLIDRGPSSAGVIAFARTHGFQSVMGNHDAKMVRYLRKKYNGTPNLEKSGKPDYIKLGKELSWEDEEWLFSLPYYIKLPEYDAIIVHAGIPGNVRYLPPMEEIKNYPNSKRGKYESLYYVRYVDASGMMAGNVFSQTEGLYPWFEKYDGCLGHVFYGHQAYKQDEPKYDTFSTGLDLASCFGGTLCGILLEKGEVVDTIVVPAKQVYAILRGS